MKVLQILKYLINISFLVFFVSTVLGIIGPFNDSFYSGSEMESYMWIQLTYIIVHSAVIFMILLYLRRFIVNSVAGKPLDKSTRKSLTMAGIFCLVYGVLQIPQFTALFSFYLQQGTTGTSVMSYGFMEFGSVCFTFLIGLFFIYLSKVLELSDMLEKENQLTI